ncbi:MAG: magnesium chelatase subunit D [Pseudomonadota bacterium]
MTGTGDITPDFDDVFERGIATWETALRIAEAFAVDPSGCGGIWLQARSGSVRDALMERVRTAVGDDVAWRRLPSSITDDRLLGGLDLASTLSSGKPVMERGLLAEIDGGVCVLPMAERLGADLAARLVSVMDTGVVRVERDGFAARDETRFGVVALDEATEDDDFGLPTKLSDRLAFRIDLSAVPYACVRVGEAAYDASVQTTRILNARRLLRDVEVPSELMVALCHAAAGLGVQGLRPVMLAVSVTRVLAALEGRTLAEMADAALAGQWVLGQRATQLPQAPPAEDQDEEPPGDNAPDDPSDDQLDQDDNETQTVPDALPEDMLLDAIHAALPDGLLAQLMAQMARRDRAVTSGPAGVRSASKLRGRPKGTSPGALRSGARLNLISTLRAAAPWQTMRRAEKGLGTGDVDRVERKHVFVKAQDFRIKRFQNRSESVTIFAVDASGSSAAQRLAEAKGAVELLLAECYIRRDHVALVAFRGTHADVLLPPTRSLVRAKRALSGLPGGGGTPLADGVMSALTLALGVKRRGQTPAVVMLTDGRGNVARDGAKGREAGQADADAAARVFRAQGVRAVVIDTSRRPQEHAAQLATAMGARYLPLPNADAHRLSAAIGGFVSATPTS